jgi:hypothetical protein
MGFEGSVLQRLQWGYPSVVRTNPDGRTSKMNQYATEWRERGTPRAEAPLFRMP